jgi:5-methylcytosine-specific restriction endonuclease McrA
MKKGKHKHFCSVKCRQAYISYNKGKYSYKWSKVNIPCEVCKEDVERQPSAVRERVFCGSECYAYWLSENRSGENSPTWRGGADPHRGVNWAQIAEEIRERDGYVCAECGSRQLERRHDVHHIIPWRFFDDMDKANDHDNLITLCRSCHSKQESHNWIEVPTDLQHKIVDIC